MPTMQMYNHSTPRSAGLPITTNMPFISNSVPHRSRNMTGIYLGLEGNSKPPRSKSAIPPLARGRGMSFRVRTPAEDRRYKMVEGLRIKEEKKGFVGSSLRNCKSASTSVQEQRKNQRVDRRKWGPGRRLDPNNIDDLIRPNPRSFTAISNSGVTRSERLVGWVPPGDPYIVGGAHDPYSMGPPDLVTEDVVGEVSKMASGEDNMAGLEECYRRICKGRVEALHSLLPNRRAQNTHYRRDNVGFTVRSYRNPAAAEILAEFPDPRHPGRPKTVPIHRPLVPAPYFFRHNTPINTRPNTTKGGASGQFEDADILVPRILAAPGAGGISRTLQYGTSPLLQSLQLLNGKEYMQDLPLTARSADLLAGEDIKTYPAEVTAALPDKGQEGDEASAEAKLKGEKGDEAVGESVINMSHIVIGPDGDEEECKENMSVMSDGRPRPRLTTSNSGADIMLGLETDEGQSAEVEIDSLETDELRPEEPFTIGEGEIPKGRERKTSIVEKLSKSRESEKTVTSILENAGQRQRDFKKLINEHQELVQEISRTPSSENIVQAQVDEEGRDP